MRGGVRRGRVLWAGQSDDLRRDDDVEAAVGRAVVVEELAHVDRAVEIDVAVGREADPLAALGDGQSAPARGEGEGVALFAGQVVVLVRSEHVSDGCKGLGDGVCSGVFAQDEIASDREGTGCNDCCVPTAAENKARFFIVVFDGLYHLSEPVKVTDAARERADNIPKISQVDRNTTCSYVFNTVDIAIFFTRL